MWQLLLGLSVLLTLRPVSGEGTLGPDLQLAKLELVLKMFLPGNSVLVPLGDWSADNLKFLCGDLPTDGCSFVSKDNEDLAPLSNNSVLSPITWFNTEEKCSNCPHKIPVRWEWVTESNLEKLALKDLCIKVSWYHSVPYSAVDKYRTKFFVMSSLDQMSLAERVCDADFYRHCLGIVVLSDKGIQENLKGSDYMPIIQIVYKDDHVLMSVKYEACVIKDTNFAMYNLTSGKLVTKMSFNWALNCRRNIKRKTLKIVDALHYPEDMKRYVKGRGKVVTRISYPGLDPWISAEDSLGFKMEPLYHLPELKPSQAVGPFNGSQLIPSSIRQTLLGNTDSYSWGLVHSASTIKVNNDGDLEPHLIAHRYGRMFYKWAIVCLLPKKVPSLYNIVMIYPVHIWVAVAVSVIITSIGFIIINQVYSKLSDGQAFKKWYEVILLVFSTLFAEDFPSKWYTKGLAQNFLTLVWNLAAMFIVFIFLCNLRAVLLEPRYEKVPGNLEELLESDFNVYLYKHRTAGFDVSSVGKQMRKQGRAFETDDFFGVYGYLDKGKNCGFNYQRNFEYRQKKSQREKQKSIFKFFHFGNPVHNGWQMLKSNPYRAIMKPKFDQMEESGLLMKFAQVIVPFHVEEKDPLVPLDLEHFFVCLVGIVAGLGLASFCFAIEKVGSKKKGKIEQMQKTGTKTKEWTKQMPKVE